MSSLATSSALTRRLARAISSVRTRPAADSIFGTSSTPGGAAASRRCTSSGVATLDIISTSGRSMPARSSTPPVSSGLMRTPAMAPLLRQRAKAAPESARARGRRAGGVKSSSSRMMTWAPERAAASCADSSAPGTKSQLRRASGTRAAPARPARGARRATARGGRPDPAASRAPHAASCSARRAARRCTRPSRPSAPALPAASPAASRPRRAPRASVAGAAARRWSCSCSPESACRCTAFCRGHRRICTSAPARAAPRAAGLQAARSSAAPQRLRQLATAGVAYSVIHENSLPFVVVAANRNAARQNCLFAPQAGAALLLHLASFARFRLGTFALEEPPFELSLLHGEVLVARFYFAGKRRARPGLDRLAARRRPVAVARRARRVDALVHLRLRRQSEGEQGGRESELHSWCCGFTRSILLSSLLSALI